MSRPKPLLLLLFFCLAFVARSQRSTFSAGINTGLYWFTGDQASDRGFVFVYPQLQSSTHGIAGTKSGFSYEANLRWQQTLKSRFLFGAELAWQSLEAKAEVEGLSPISSFYSGVTGNVSLRSQYICATPFAGYRLLNRKLLMDFTGGVEMAACVNRQEEVAIIYQDSGERAVASNSLSRRPDFRLRLQVNATVGRVGFLTGYACGLTNFYDYGPENRNSAYSQFLKIGLNYVLN